MSGPIHFLRQPWWWHRARLRRLRAHLWAVMRLAMLAAVLLWLWSERGGVPDLLGERSALTADGAAIRLKDGDSFTTSGTEVRLDGVDAPEYAQMCRDAAGREWACGREARAVLAGLIGGAAITCESRDTDRYGRMVAVCRTPAGDLGAAMVTAGMARNYGLSGTGPYWSEEAGARAAGRGIWQGAHDEPAAWRRARERGEPPEQAIDWPALLRRLAERLGFG